MEEQGSSFINPTSRLSPIITDSDHGNNGSTRQLRVLESPSNINPNTGKKKLQPSSPTALPPRTKYPKKSKRKSKRCEENSNNRHLIAKFGCSQCEYRTNFPHRLQRHKELHQKKSDHQCSYCSYSAKRKRDIYSHMKSYHKSRTNQNGQSFYPANGGARIRIFGCVHCKYKTRERNNLVKHMEKMHPSSTFPTSPAPLIKRKATVMDMMHQCADCEFETKCPRDFGRHRMYHEEKSTHQCPWCSYSVNFAIHLTRHVKQFHTKIDMKALPSDKQVNPAPPVSIQRTEQWHYFPNGIRKRYKLCGDCDYKTTTNFNLDGHIKLVHPFSTTALQPSITNKEKNRFRCSHCQFKAEFRAALERHDACHRNKSAKYRCHLCSYSVNHPGHLTVHLARHHRENNNNKRGTEKNANYTDRQALTCRYCQQFKTTSLFTMKRHVKKSHPFSLSALPPLPNKSEKPRHPFKKSGNKVAEKPHQPVEDAASPIIPEETQEEAKTADREEWYVPPSGKRTRYIYCGDCDYRTVARYYLKRHAEIMHPSSITANPVQPPKEAWTKLRRCAHCDFSTKDKRQFMRHQVFHENKSEHQCTQCSFSCSTIAQLKMHLGRNHREVPKKSWLQCTMCSFRGDKMKNLIRHQALHETKSKFQCHLCSYSVKTIGNLRVHVERHHPPEEPSSDEEKTSSTVITRTKDVEVAPKIDDPMEPTVYDCKFCDFSTVLIRDMKKHKWGHRRNEKYKCTLCSYSSDSKGVRNRHMNQQHKKSIVKQADVIDVGSKEASMKKKKKHLHKCLECDYSTSEKSNMDKHKMSHQRNGKFKCPHCSFSSNFQNPIFLHFKYGHHRNLKMGVPAHAREMEFEEKLRKQFGIYECRVMLYNIFSIKGMNLENEELLPSKEAHPIANGTLEDENQLVEYRKIQLLRSRLKIMKIKERIAEKEVKEISSKKMDVQKIIEDILGRRALIEYDLRSEQCNLLELSLSALDDEDDHSGIMDPMEEKIKNLENEMSVIDRELFGLKEEEKNLAQDLDDAQNSHLGIVQVLESLKSELDGLL